MNNTLTNQEKAVFLWTDCWGRGFAVWNGPDLVELFETLEESHAFLNEKVRQYQLYHGETE